MFKYDRVQVQGAVQHGKEARGMRRASGRLLLRGPSLTYSTVTSNGVRLVGTPAVIALSTLAADDHCLGLHWTSSRRINYVSIVFQVKRVPDDVESYLACEIWPNRSVNIIP
jgi:hypothetical protein